MASAGGLTRRRGGGRPAGPDEQDDSRVSSPVSRNGSAMDHRGPETSFTAGQNGHKIAFDPRDLSETEERNKQPKLTLMEEVLLLGLKDKQVSSDEGKTGFGSVRIFSELGLLTPWALHRVIYRSGMRTSLMLCEVVLSLSSHFVVG